VARWTDRVATWLTARPLTLFLLIYALLALLGVVAETYMPAELRQAVDALTGGRGLGAMDSQVFSRAAARMAPPEEMWLIASVAMVTAAVFGVPVAWLYTITRQKRGFRQSVVHTLILLPVIVAGVVVLVKYSLALAFSLAGIVAAVRFRTTLEDSKDAVYVFVATGIGLASGVELTAAATLSFVFNLITLILFRSDFGRMPSRLEGDVAEDRMRRALSGANRTSQFVARIDREILKEMAPQQLEALADRAWQRRREAAPDAGPGEEKGFDTSLRVLTDGSPNARSAAERVLTQTAKRWQYNGSEPGPTDQTVVLEYAMRLRKSITPTLILDALRAEERSGVLEANLK
jgi:ABC-type multidrug transport system fused ATPase/permease subunit